MWLRIVLGAARTQLRLTRNNVEDLRPIVTMPPLAVVAIAVLVHSGRPELAPYALVASSLMTIGQMGLFVFARTMAC